MKKIPSLFLRDFGLECPALDEVTPGCEWVLEGEGTAFVKRDGTATLIKDGHPWKRFNRKLNREGFPRKAPKGWVPCEPEPNEDGHWTGWAPITDQDRWFLEAFETPDVIVPALFLGSGSPALPDGTYELCGPHFQGNPEGLPWDTLIHHGSEKFNLAKVSFFEISGALSRIEREGFVWHHPDGRMAKVKKSDFGMTWPIPRVARKRVRF